MCVYDIHIYLSVCLSIHLYTYTYIYIYICVCVCIYEVGRVWNTPTVMEIERQTPRRSRDGLPARGHLEARFFRGRLILKNSRIRVRGFKYRRVRVNPASPPRVPPRVGLHKIVMTNIVLGMVYYRGVGEESFIAQWPCNSIAIG